jgi:transcriptional regulator with XRE-family HTH domain
MADEETTSAAKGTVHEWLADELRRRGWSQSELARRSGLSRPTINKYLRPPDHPHHRAPDFASLSRIATALDVPVLAAVQAANASRPANGISPLQRECAALILGIPDDLLAALVYQLRPLADPEVQRSIRERTGRPREDGVFASTAGREGATGEVAPPQTRPG